MSKIKEVPEDSEWNRVSAHTHIRGLGIVDGEAKDGADGMVGQSEAREAADLVVDLVKEGKFGGHGILLAGPPGSGKTAIALGISKELGNQVPFVQIAGSEIYSTDMKKTEFLTQSLRKSIGVKISEERDVYEGKVGSVDISQGQSNPMNPYGGGVSSAKITLETKDDSKTLSLGKQVASQIQKNGIEEGDVVEIDEETGKISKQGRSEDATDKDTLVSGNIVPTPSGDISKTKDFTHTLSLHQLDRVNSQAASRGMASMFFGSSGNEISKDLRNKVDSQVKEWVESGKAEIKPGVLFIDECSILDVEAFAFLNRAMENELSPILVFATNRGITKIKGTDIESPHGMPLDLLDRLLIINTQKYKREEIKKIIGERVEEEDVDIDENALDLLSDIGEETSLRYSTRLVGPCQQAVKKEDKEKIEEEDIKKVRKLYSDINESSQYLKDQEKEFLEG